MVYRWLQTTAHLAAVIIPEAAVVLSVPGHRGPVVGPGQLSPTREAQAILLQQVCWEAYLKVFMLKQTAHRCRDIYSTGSICFTNTDKKCLVWQQYLVGNFGFALHILLYWALRSKRWQGWHTCRVVVWASASLWRWQQAFSFLFLYWRCFFLFLVILLVFWRRQEHYAAQTEISVDCWVSAACSVFHAVAGSVQVCGWKCCIQDFLPECWFVWKPSSLSLASVVSVV